jgi:hypothetical protein
MPFGDGRFPCLLPPCTHRRLSESAAENLFPSCLFIHPDIIALQAKKINPAFEQPG